MTQRLVDLAIQGGLVAVCHVSEADVGPGEWRIPPGELQRAFAKVEGFDAREGDGVARLLGRRME